MKLNCAAIPTGLLESELFGHERGAFTSAIAQRIGRFELANRGTIFLDEIGEIPLELQPKLLRVLQEREFERLGSSRTLTTDARLIAATNRDLGALVQEQKFRSDLFYRLNVFPVRVPPLPERREDIPLLVQHFVQRFSKRMNRNIESVPKQGMDALINYRWPGNIRELENVIERAVILSSGPGSGCGTLSSCSWSGRLEAADLGRGRAGTHSGNVEENALGVGGTEWGSDSAGIESLDPAIPNEEARHRAPRPVIGSNLTYAAGTEAGDRLLTYRLRSTPAPSFAEGVTICQHLPRNPLPFIKAAQALSLSPYYLSPFPDSGETRAGIQRAKTQIGPVEIQLTSGPGRLL